MKAFRHCRRREQWSDTSSTDGYNRKTNRIHLEKYQITKHRQATNHPNNMEGNELLLVSPSSTTPSSSQLPSSSSLTYEMFQYSLQVADVVNISITTTSYEYIGNNGSTSSNFVDSHVVNETDISTTTVVQEDNYWALLAIILVVVTAGGNILVCLAITWERRLQNVTNYFLMSLAITDLMVAVLVMPFAILTLFKGKLTFSCVPIFLYNQFLYSQFNIKDIKSFFCLDYIL